MSSVELVAHRYGKARVRLIKITRGAGHNDVTEWTVKILLKGDFAAAHTGGDNTNLIATDTMKNTVYALAHKSPARTMEDFAHELVRHLIDRNEQVSAAEVEIEAALWKRLTVGGRLHADTFMRGSMEVQTALVEGTRNAETMFGAGFAGMHLLKTANSAFSGFQRDAFTTLPETRDRLFGTVIDAAWKYTPGTVDFGGARILARETMIGVFADHDSESVQHTLYAMAEAALAAVPQMREITLTMPNKHCLLVDLERFGQQNDNEIFVPTDEPHGYIEATVRKK